MANDEHLKILKRSVPEWNQWREDKPNIKPDLRNAELSGEDLRFANFRKTDFYGANLSEANLSGAYLSYSLLSYAILRRADLRGTDLRYADLSDATLLGADFSGADLSGANLNGLNLNHTTFSYAMLRDASINGTDLRYAILTEANLKGADLRGADLSGADLRGAVLSEANLSHATVRGAVFRGADLSGTTLMGANLSRGTDFSGADLSGADLNEAILSKANLNGVDLSQANLCEANLSGAILKHAKLNESFLVKTNFSDANLEKANLTGICLSHIITYGWNIKEIECEYVYLDKTKEKRYPEHRDFRVGEFERLFCSVPTIEFIFEKGMKWIDALIMDWIAARIHEKKPEFGLDLLCINRQGIYPRAIFGIASHKLKDEAKNEINEQYKNAIQVFESQSQYSIDQLFDLLIQALYEPHNQITDSSDLFAIPGNVHIKISIIIQAIEEIKQVVKKEPEEYFKGKTKKKILEILDEAVKAITKGAIEEAGKKIFELAQTDLIPLLPQIAACLAVLKMTFPR